MSLCHGCGTELPPNKVPSPPRKWCSERCRRSQYVGECVHCGATTNGSDGPGLAPKICHPCHTRLLHEQRYWTRERVIASIREFVAENERPPRAADFHPSLARQKGHEERARRAEAKGYPNPSMIVAREFGSWNNAIIAAGFEPFDNARDHVWGPGRSLYGENAA